MKKPKPTYDPVPAQVFEAVADALFSYADTHPKEYESMREFLTRYVQANRVEPFSKDYRHEVTPAHSLIYLLISTVAANSGSPQEIDGFYRAYHSI